MKAQSTEMPQTFLPIGNGKWHYNYNITSKAIENKNHEITMIFEYSYVVINGKPEYDSCVTSVIRDCYTVDSEIALLNKYNSYLKGIIIDSSIESDYHDYLEFVRNTKIQVKRDLHIVPTEKTLDEMKAEKIDLLYAYDKSSSVNSFFLNDKQLWVDKDTRVGLMNSTMIQKEAGMETTSLWFDGEAYVIPVYKAIELLSALEMYALRCYNVTAQHEADILLMQTPEELDNYVFTTGYPDKLKLYTY